MATYSANPSVSGAVSATSSAGSATLYTAPANSYAIIQFYNDLPGGGAVVTIGGRIVVNGGSQKLFTFYIGPGQAIAFAGNVGGTLEVSGVQFTNGV